MTGAPDLPPRSSLAGARSAYVSPSLRLSAHRNAAATVAVALDAPFALSVAPRDAPPAVRWAALIPPNTLHQLVATGRMVFVYLDPLGEDHRRMGDLGLDDARLRSVLAEAGAAWDADRLVRALGLPDRPPTDPRIAAAVRHLDEHPQDFPRVSDLAAVAGLSPSRFQALFSRATGLPFRRYRLWRRMAVVLHAASRGASLTDAALDAGFSGAAHPSSTFRDRFGLSPSALLASGVEITIAGAPGATAARAPS